jgi:hypothetical protein
VDAALRNCGIGSALLVPVLSAIIPPGAAIHIGASPPSHLIERWPRLPVLAAMRSVAGGEGGIAAAIGWYPCRDGSKVIVAHDAAAEDAVLAELDVLSSIYASLRDMVEGRSEPFDGLRVETHGVSAPVDAGPITVAMLAILDLAGDGLADHPADLAAERGIHPRPLELRR